MEELLERALSLVEGMLVELQIVTEPCDADFDEDTMRRLKEGAALALTLRAAPEEWKERLREIYKEQSAGVEFELWKTRDYVRVPGAIVNQWLIKEAEGLLEEARRAQLLKP
jgi:hypothetical protein